MIFLNTHTHTHTQAKPFHGAHDVNAAGGCSLFVANLAPEVADV